MTHAQPPMTCDAVKQAIEARHFVGRRGLSPGCAPDVVFGIKLDDLEAAVQDAADVVRP